jgi:alkylated DNA nucleotide flippase Atl1
VIIKPLIFAAAAAIGVGAGIAAAPAPRFAHEVTSSSANQDAGAANTLWEQALTALRANRVGEGIGFLDRARIEFEALKRLDPAKYDLPWAKVVVTLAGLFVDDPNQRAQAKPLLDEGEPVLRRLASSSDDARIALRGARLLRVRVHAARNEGAEMCATAREILGSEALELNIRNWLDGIVARCPSADSPIAPNGAAWPLHLTTKSNTARLQVGLGVFTVRFELLGFTTVIFTDVSTVEGNVSVFATMRLGDGVNRQRFNPDGRREWKRDGILQVGVSDKYSNPFSGVRVTIAPAGTGAVDVTNDTKATSGSTGTPAESANALSRPEAARSPIEQELVRTLDGAGAVKWNRRSTINEKRQAYFENHQRLVSLRRCTLTLALEHKSGDAPNELDEVNEAEVVLDLQQATVRMDFNRSDPWEHLWEEKLARVAGNVSLVSENNSRAIHMKAIYRQMWANGIHEEKQYDAEVIKLRFVSRDAVVTAANTLERARQNCSVQH